MTRPNALKPQAPYPATGAGSHRGWLHDRIGKFARHEDGTASLEFVLVVPMLLMIFMASFESGLLMTRHLLLERAVDITMRELRIGSIKNPTHDLIKSEICNRTIILKDCDANIRVELTPVSTQTWQMPAVETTCVDRSQQVQPPLMFNPGAPNEVMLVRVCVVQDALFPTTGIGLALPKDGSGGYGLIATSAFVNEP